MPKYTVHKNPFKRDVDVVEADRYEESGSFTKFYKDDAEVYAIPTNLVTKIEVES